MSGAVNFPASQSPTLHSTLTWNSFSLSHLTSIAPPPTANYSDQAPTASVQSNTLLTQVPSSLKVLQPFPQWLPLLPQGLCTGCKCSLCLGLSMSSLFPFAMLTPTHSSEPSSKVSFKGNSSEPLGSVSFSVYILIISFTFHSQQFILIWVLRH